MRATATQPQCSRCVLYTRSSRCQHQDMPRPRAPYHHGDLRNALVAAAAQMVERDGEERFSLREAARSVGVTANAAYRHFADRSALLTAVAASGFEELSRRMGAAMVRGERDARGEIGRAHV